MSNKSKDLDKFYTHPDIAKKFVDIIDNIFPLKNFDLILEPSAGNGNILQYLPENSIGLDIEPEAENIIKQDFFEYHSPYDPIFNNINKNVCLDGNLYRQRLGALGHLFYIKFYK
jgi:hypothetical protein